MKIFALLFLKFEITPFYLISIALPEFGFLASNASAFLGLIEVFKGKSVVVEPDQTWLLSGVWLHMF